jgi:hypothetical protein
VEDDVVWPEEAGEAMAGADGWSTQLSATKADAETVLDAPAAVAGLIGYGLVFSN